MTHRYSGDLFFFFRWFRGFDVPCFLYDPDDRAKRGSKVRSIRSFRVQYRERISRTTRASYANDAGCRDRHSISRHSGSPGSLNFPLHQSQSHPKMPVVTTLPLPKRPPNIHLTPLTFPVSTSYTHPLTVTLSGTALLRCTYATSSLTASSRSGNGRKSKPPSASLPSAPRFASTTLYASSFRKVNMPQPVCLITNSSVMPRSCSEMTMERRASRTDPPALQMTWASPSSIPKAAAGSIRASMQVTTYVLYDRSASFAFSFGTTGRNGHS